MKLGMIRDYFIITRRMESKAPDAADTNKIRLFSMATLPDDLKGLKGIQQYAQTMVEPLSVSHPPYRVLGKDTI